MSNCPYPFQGKFPPIWQVDDTTVQCTMLNVQCTTLQYFIAMFTAVFYCGIQFSTSRTLADHEKLVHQKEEPKFICEICDKAFGKLSNCIWHQKVHSSDKSYVSDHRQTTQFWYLLLYGPFAWLMYMFVLFGSWFHIIC